MYSSMALVVLAWSLGLACVHLGRKVWSWCGKVGYKLMDECEEDSNVEGADSEDDAVETTPLLS